MNRKNRIIGIYFLVLSCMLLNITWPVMLKCESIEEVHSVLLPEPEKEESPEVWITVFIHGIINIKPHLSFSNIIRFMRDQISDSVYARAVEIMRKDPFFYQFYAMQGLGLQKIDGESQAGHASGAFAVAYDSFNSLNVQNRNQKNNYYTFGWSGLLSTQVRYQEAMLLYEQLEKEVEAYKKEGINPKVRVIGYSHGGYIALNLGAASDARNLSEPSWFVDELLLIGVPVISDTDFMINSPLFKKVYHFYSPGDRVQVIDCLATNRFFSHRIFSSRVGFFIPDKLTQIQFRCRRIARTKHAHNACKHHTHHYPSRLLRNADPGHTELWSFGWTAGYRSHLPIYPFPAGAYLNYILNALDQCSHLSNHIVVEIHAFQDKMHVGNLGSYKREVIPFATKQERDQIALLIEPYIPEKYNRQLYAQKAQRALASAHEQKTDEWKQRQLAKGNWVSRRFAKAA